MYGSEIDKDKAYQAMEYVRQMRDRLRKKYIMSECLDSVLAHNQVVCRDFDFEKENNYLTCPYCYEDEVTGYRCYCQDVDIPCPYSTKPY